MSKKSLIILTACVGVCIIAIALSYILLSFKTDVETNKFNPNNTNYLTLTEKIYSTENARDSALNYPLYVIDNKLNLYAMDGKEQLNLFGNLTPFSPSLNEFESQISNPNIEDNFSSKEFFENNQQAWIAISEMNDNYYILFEQKDGRYYFAIGHINDMNSPEFIKVIFNAKITVQNAPQTIHD